MAGYFCKTVDYFRRTREWVLDTIFPPRCIQCQTFTGKRDFRYLCRSCFAALPQTGRKECVGCGLPSHHGRTCDDCVSEWHLDRLLVVTDYRDQTVQKILTFLKYRFIEELAVPLCALVRRYVRQRAQRGDMVLATSPLITAVPLHPRRLRWRGFNQAALIASRTAQYFQMDYRSALERVRQGTPQVEQPDRAARLASVEGLFMCAETDAVRGKDVLLFDDVCTTGATLRECARVLKKAGAAHVTALVIARG